MSILFILALDGATFPLFEPWMQAGELPNLAVFRSQAAYGPLESTIPPITGAAWTTFQTGTNPGKHGVFDWLKRDPNGYNLVPISAQMLSQPTLWELLSAHDRRVSVLGVPVTYPPRPVNGYVVSGLLAPPGAAYTYPKSLQAELEHAVPGYTTAPEHWQGRHQSKAWLNELKASLQRKLAATHFMLRKPWDVFMVHFMETDTVQHQMWQLIDGVPRPHYHADDVGENAILEVFRAFDRALPELLAAAGKDTTVVILSDHGFGPLYWNIHLNNWLLRSGFLKLKRSATTLLKRASFFGLGLTPERMYPLAERSGYLGRNAQLRHAQIYKRMGRVFLSHQNIDWKRTRAYSFGNVGQIYLNRRGRDPQGIVSDADQAALLDEIQAGLMELKNPSNGERVLEQIHLKEAIYHGPALNEAPELMLQPREGYMAVGTSEFVSKHTVSPAFAGSGWHRMNGILMVRGQHVCPGQLHDARLLDMSATLLYEQGLPVPSSFDGKVLKRLFQPEFLHQNPLKNGHVATTSEHNGRLPGGYEAEIRKRLQSLGYI